MKCNYIFENIFAEESSKSVAAGKPKLGEPKISLSKILDNGSKTEGHGKTTGA